MKAFVRAALLSTLLLLLAACGGYQAVAPVSSRTAAAQATLGQHTVQSGETLYSIAWQYGFDYKTLAAWNRIKPPYRIKQGQRLTLIPSASTQAKAAPRAPRKSDTTSSKQEPGEPSPESDDDNTVAAPANLTWMWPAKGDLLAKFGTTKGINIAGQEGDPVNATSAGRVVYSGSGLVGLGELVIVKHNETWLSAYAHNKLRLVQEGDKVKAGQTIAQMGRTGTDRVMLHFEVRKDGKPVDPLQYLPKQR
ncbi:MAG: peptidoglycan DD-metalloendopeptidase family protein [Gammaproteobacteria bacterium]|nr:peptidoglycan DD-metalloendopeptidase family protein [Gammaproteobacteria bacterium]